LAPLGFKVLDNRILSKPAAVYRQPSTEFGTPSPT
jgi:hypothetical protein